MIFSKKKKTIYRLNKIINDLRKYARKLDDYQKDYQKFAYERNHEKRIEFEPIKTETNSDRTRSRPRRNQTDVDLGSKGRNPDRTESFRSVDLQIEKGPERQSHSL